METTIQPARAIAPGWILTRELEARGWTQKDLAGIMGRPPQAINEIVKGSKQITPETALELAEAFGTSAELWINLEANFRLALARSAKDGKDIARKSRLYSLAPVTELLKRGWIRPGSSFEELEQAVYAFMGISSPDEMGKLAVSFRHAVQRGPELNAQIAWVRRVEQAAAARTVARFDQARLEKILPAILACSAHEQDVARLPGLLADAGVHFVIVGHLDKTFLDGAKLMCGKNPIIALTLRYDRIDSFWFTLLHELAHIFLKHKGSYLDDLYGGDHVDGEEKDANRLAGGWLLDDRAFKAFVSEAKPYFSKSVITRFAVSQGRHPGIVLGRLQHEQLVDYKNLRGMLMKVSPYLGEWVDR
ncbi:MAG: HigA family addiction module antidote protein [Desulfuromonadales bacterium]|nr:HigA family addiction module antidote protein [Desulfuromonadales bacterium]